MAAYAVHMDRPEKPLHIVPDGTDQVQRRRDFQAAHPEWRIYSDGYGHWHGERDRPDGSDTVVMNDLGELLDELEAR